MGIEARYWYREIYLQSDDWKNIRVEKLVKSEARCFFCGHQSNENDVHHIHYPAMLADVTIEDLRVLCRKHHKEVHSVMDEIKGEREFGCDLGKKDKSFLVWRSAMNVIRHRMRQKKERFYGKDIPFSHRMHDDIGHENIQMRVARRETYLRREHDRALGIVDEKQTYRENLRNALQGIEHLRKKLGVLLMSTRFVDGDVARIEAEYEAFYRKNHATFMRLIETMASSKEHKESEKVLAFVKEM